MSVKEKLIDSSKRNREKLLKKIAEPKKVKSNPKKGSRNIQYEELLKDDEFCMEIAGFLPTEFDELFNNVKIFLVGRSVVGTGRKSTIDEQDMLVILLCYLHRSMTNRSLSLEFGFKKAYLSTLIPNLLERLEFFAENVMRGVLEQYLTNRKEFESFPNCLIATDCTLINHPPPGKLASFDEQKNYFSPKHGRYGYKFMAFVSADGFCVYASPLFKGSVHDVDILREDEQNVKKIWVEGTSVLGDTGFVGQVPIPMILPFKQPINGVLTRQQDEFNLTVARERVLIENFFGRLKVKWPAIEKAVRVQVDRLASFVRIVVALTNLDLKARPLRRQCRELNSQQVI